MLTACSLLWIASTVSSLSGCESKRQCPVASREKRIHAFSWVVGKLPEWPDLGGGGCVLCL